MVILIDVEKAFDKIQCFIIIKVSKIRIERNFLNMIKGIYFLKNPANRRLLVKIWKFSLKDQEQDKGAYFPHCYSTLSCKF